MNELFIPDFLNELVDAGIEITIRKDQRLGSYFDLNLQAKSHMFLYIKNNAWHVSMRYEGDYELDMDDPIDDLKSYARSGMYGRDYINCAWAEFLMSDKERADKKLAKEAMAKLTPEEILAIQNSKLF
jgi:hypothetical protein